MKVDVQKYLNREYGRLKKIWSGQNDHRHPVEGDHGIRFEWDDVEGEPEKVMFLSLPASQNLHEVL